MESSLFDVSKEIVVITGVSGQLGKEYATNFVNSGAKVIGIDLTLSDELKKSGLHGSEKFKFLCGDITKKSSIINCLSEIKNTFGIPTVLINNAALDSPPNAPSSETGRFEDYPEESWNKVMEVNLRGIFICCQVFGEVMAMSKKGSIINISSIYGVVSPDQSLYDYRRKRGEMFYKPVAYSASKSGILNLTRYLAVYWAKQNVRVNTLTIAGVFNNQEKEFLDSYCARIPIGRMAASDEYNGSVIFLASSASRYMTGHNMVVDGGWTSI